MISNDILNDIKCGGYQRKNTNIYFCNKFLRYLSTMSSNENAHKNIPWIKNYILLFLFVSSIHVFIYLYVYVINC